MPTPSPLGSEHLVKINDALQQLTDVQLAIDQAKRAGIDIGDKEKEVEDARKKLMALKQVYFPGQ